MAMSGVHAALALLIKDKENSEIDSIQEELGQPGESRRTSHGNVIRLRKGAGVDCG